MAKSVYIADVCKEIFAGGDVPKDALSYEKTEEYNVPIFSNGEKNCGLYGYTNNARVKESSITVSARGTIGYTAIRTEPFVPVVRLITLTPKSEVIDLDYLFYATQNYKFEGSGTSIPQLTVPILKKYKFPLPEMSHQKAIAVKFEKLDQLISLRKQQLAKLDELVKARFVEMFGDPIRNEKGWNTYTLAEMCDGIGDGLHGTPEYDENGEYPFINGNNLISGIIQINPSTKKVNKKTYEKHYIKISQNAILLSINGTLGKIAFYNGEQVMLGKSACYCNLKDEVNRIFVYNIMKTDAFARYLEDNATKSTIKNVGLKAIREYRLIMPPIPLQNQFSSFVERVDQQKQTVQQSLEKLELMKKALMQEYFG